MNYYEMETIKRLKSIDKSLKYIARIIEAVVTADYEEEVEEAPQPTQTSAIGFEVTGEADDSE